MEKAKAYKLDKGWLIVNNEYLNSFNKDEIEIEFEIPTEIINNMSYKELRNASILDSYNEKLKFQIKYDLDKKYHKEFVKKHNVPDFNDIEDFLEWVRVN